MTFTGAVVRFRYVLMLLATVAVALGFYAWLKGGAVHGDINLERMAGAEMFHSLHVYDRHAEVMIGPIPLAIMGLATKLPTWGGPVLLDALTVGCAVICSAALERIALNLGASARRAGWAALGGGLALLGAFASVASTSHLEDAIAVTAVLMAVASLTGRRPWWLPALLLGFAVSCKPWAVVTVPLLLHLDRDRGKAFAVTAAVAFAPWAPFVIGAPHTIAAFGSVYNLVWPKSVLRVFGFAFGADAPPAARALAMLVGVAAGALAALRGRWLAVPLAGFAGRMLLETHWFLYYGALAVAGALVWDLSRHRRWPVWTLWAIVAEYGLQELIPWYSYWGAALNAVFALSVIGGLVLAPRQAEVKATAISEAEQDVAVLRAGQA